MGAPLGLFDPTAVPAGWFDETAQPAGWFDKDLLDVTSSGVTAAISVTQQSDTWTLSGSATVSGAISVSQASDTWALSGNISSASVDAAIAWTQQNDSWALSGTSDAVESTKTGGDDYPGFNLAEWKKNRRLDDGIGETLERLINGPAASEVVAAVQAESKAAEFNPARLRALLEQIERYQQEENDIEAILLSL